MGGGKKKRSSLPIPHRSEFMAWISGAQKVRNGADSIRVVSEHLCHGLCAWVEAEMDPHSLELGCP